MVELPGHILAQIQQLADEGKPVEEIAFMLRLTDRAVRQVLSDTRKKGLSNSRSKHARASAGANR